MGKMTYYNTEWEDPAFHPELAEWVNKEKDNTL